MYGSIIVLSLYNNLKLANVFNFYVCLVWLRNINPPKLFCLQNLKNLNLYNVQKTDKNTKKYIILCVFECVRFLFVNINIISNVEFCTTFFLFALFSHCHFIILVSSQLVLKWNISCRSLIIL